MNEVEAKRLKLNTTLLALDLKARDEYERIKAMGDAGKSVRNLYHDAYYIIMDLLKERDDIRKLAYEIMQKANGQ